MSEDVSNSQLFPKSKGVEVIEGDMTILTYQPYPLLFEYIKEDLPRHDSKVQLSNSIQEFKGVLRDEIKVDLELLSNFISPKPDHPKYRYAITDIRLLIQRICSRYDYDQCFVSDFYKGLTVSSSNVLSTSDCILRNQDEKRFMFRPILEYNIDGVTCNIIGYNKLIESFVTLSINCFPFGHCPEEWKKYKPIKKFVEKVTKEHDSLLETPLEDYLKEKKVKVDRNIRSFKTKHSEAIPIDVKGLGEIDLIFIDEQNKILYLGECKHNRSRFDMNNWKRDYTNFVKEYEPKLARKENWVNKNLSIVKEHFEVLYKCSIDLEGYVVKASFFINAPTVYMHNGKYRAHTFIDLQNIIEGNFVDTVFRFENDETGAVFEIGHPYFDNLRYELEKN